MVKRVCKAMTFTCPPNHGTTVKRPKFEVGIVQEFLGSWIRREENLETTIQAKAIDDICPHPTPDSIRSFVDGEAKSCVVELSCA